MDALCKLSEAEQEDLVARAAAGEKVSAKEVLAAKKKKPEPAPVITGSAERPLDQVLAAGAALAGENSCGRAGRWVHSAVHAAHRWRSSTGAGDQQRPRRRRIPRSAR